MKRFDMSWFSCNHSSSQERKVIFTIFEKWKESTKPTNVNCNCFNDAIGRFDSIEYQQGQPGVEPFNPETFQHTCKQNGFFAGSPLHKDYGYVWNEDNMEWEPPHIQTCDAWQNGYDCMHGEGEGDYDKYRNLWSDFRDAEVSHEIIYTHTKDGCDKCKDESFDGHEYSNYEDDDREYWACCECPDVDLIAVKTEDYIITATPLDFYNYIADTYPMTWIRWNLGNSNPLNQYVKSGHYNIHNEFVEREE